MSADPVVRLAARGDGVTASGVMVPLAAPGDMLAPDGSLSAGPHRRTPPCRHFPRCGGCTLQHTDDETYSTFLRDRIAGALAAQSLHDIVILEPHLSPPRTRRRVSLRGERHGGAVLLGFNEAASHRIVDLRQCDIMHPALFALVAPLRALLGGLLPGRRAATVQMTLTNEGIDLLLEMPALEGLAAQEAITAFAAAHALARLAMDEGHGAEPRFEPRPVTVTLGGVAVPLPPGAFLQATADGEAALVEAVGQAIGPAGDTADLFAGLGTFALALPGRIHAVEGARDAALALLGAARTAGRALTVEHRDLFRRPLTAAELARFAAVVLDPPRAGAKEQAAQLAASMVPRIAYVSCNPATFARDAKTLREGGYRLEWIRPVGQFRWSTHVELVGGFGR